MKSTDIYVALPSLRRKIRSYFFSLTAAFALFGVVMIILNLSASKLTPQLIHRNYDSISASKTMRDSWMEISQGKLENQAPFEKALDFESRNITEVGEDIEFGKIQALWGTVKRNGFQMNSKMNEEMKSYIDNLISINERGMFNLANKSHQVARLLLMVSTGFLILGLLLSLIISDGLSQKLAEPLKNVSEVLRSGPLIEKALKLPKPNTLEMKILTTELKQLWQRLSDLQKLNLDELAMQRNRLETVLSAIEDAVLVLDDNGTILHVNDGFLRLLNIKLDFVKGQNWFDLSFSEPNYLKLRDFLKSDLQASNTVEIELDSKKLVYAIRRREILENQKKRLGTVFLLHDISESRLKERLKSEFVGVLSHELKTPLQSLGTATELLARRRDNLGSEIQVLIDTISEDFARIRAVANDFMQIGLLGQHSLTVNLELLPLNQHVVKWLNPFYVLAKDKSVELKFLVQGSEIIWCMIDSVKLPWAVSNIISNAIRVSSSGQTVTVVLTDRNHRADIEIIDEGPGISDAEQKRMFEPYFQGSATLGSSSAGYLGLGLTIAKEVVEAHDGYLEYHTRRPRGSMFRISLPISNVKS